MTINEIELFDLYGNGTLVMKTNVEEPRDDLRYTWYVKSNGQLIYKGTYQRNPFTAIQIEHLGLYVVRAFVRDGEGNKVELAAEFCASKKTSPVLAAAEAENDTVSVVPKVEHISGTFWQFSAEGNIPENAKYAWYIYREDQIDPIFKGSYSADANLLYDCKESGSYHAKLFVLFDGRKISVNTEIFSF